MSEKRSAKNKETPTINIWKWAFIGLVSLLILGVFMFLRAIQPVSIQTTDSENTVEANDGFSLISTITTEDAEVLMNQSIESMLVDEQMSYEIILADQLEIRSVVDLFSFKIPYTLFLDPYVTENGNLQLRATGIELASFSLPVSDVLSLLAGGLDLPFYIGIDSVAQIVLIDFNALSSQHGIGVTLKKIDLESNEIQLKLSVNQATLIEALNFDSE